MKKPAYLLDIGGTQSAFCIYHNGQPVFLREVSFGGRAITDSIGSVLNLKRLDAERIKLNGKEDMDDVTHKGVADAIQKR